MVLKYEISWVALPNTTQDFLCKLSSKSLQNFNWDEIDDWFLKNYNAIRHPIMPPIWYILDDEKYTEFYLKWL